MKNKILGKEFDQLIESLSKFPSIGEKTASRLALFLMKNPPNLTLEIAKSMVEARKKVRTCKICNNFIFDKDPDCSDKSCNRLSGARDLRTLCVVENMFDLISIENSGEYNGQYHVLQGLLSVSKGIKPEDLKINHLINRIKKNKFNENVRADTAGSAEMISKNKNKNQAAIASILSAKTYNLEIIKKNIENEKGNLTRFLIMGKNISQPEFGNKKYITSFLFKLKSKPAALYQSLGGFAINGVNLTKLQSYPEKNTFDSFFFLCDLDGHIEDIKVQKSLEELGLHCQDFHVLGVFEADKIRGK